MKKKASTLRCREDCPTKVHSEGTVFGVTAEILLSLDTATGVHTHHLFLVSLKIHRMASNSNANNCALCSKQVFLFERRVKTKDLEEQELAALMLIRKNSDFPKLLETNQSILCMSCCRKVKASNENGQQGGAGDVSSKGSSPDKHKKEERGHGAGAGTSPRHRPKKDHTANQAADPSTPQRPDTKKSGTAKQDKDTLLDSGIDPKKARTDTNKAARPTAYVVRFPATIGEVMAIALAVLLALIALGLEARGVAAGSLAAGLIIIIVKVSAERRDIYDWIRRTAEQWGFIAEQVPGVAQQEARVAAVSATVPVISQVGTCTHTLVQDGHCVTCALEVENSTEQTLDQQQVAVSASGTARQEVTVAATSAVFPGVSLVGTTTHALMQDGYWVTCAIEVENWTCFHLTDPHVQLKGGVLTVAPSVIVPAAREVMVARKTSSTATGSCGTLSWLIQDNDRRFVIMWSAPFNFNHHSNWLGIGLSAPGVTAHAPGDAWFNLMYYKESSDDLKFERREYYADVRPVIYGDADFEVEGTMASDHKALVKVILRPLSRDNLASGIKEKLVQM